MASLTSTLTAPSPKLVASIAPLPSLSAVLVAPLATVSARTGHHIVVTAPMATLTSGATVPTVLRADVVAPMATLSAHAVVGQGLSVAVTAPLATLSARTGHRIVLAAPLAQVTSAARAGVMLGAVLAAPMARVDATLTPRPGFRAVLTAPMAFMNPALRADVVAPMARATGFIQPFVLVGHDAYAVNVYSTLRGNPRGMSRAEIDGGGEEVSHYTNFPFTQIVRFGAQYYGVAADGLYLLEGVTDDGTPITWGIRTETTDFGSTTKKNPASCYVGGRLGPDSLFTVYVGEKSDKAYTYRTPRGETAQNYRRTFGRGLDARYFAFEIEGDGELAVDDLSFEIIQRTRST